MAELVAVAIPDYATALRLTGDEQGQMGLHCGMTFASAFATDTFPAPAASGLRAFAFRRQARRTTTETPPRHRN